MSNFASGRVADVLKRLEGIGDVYILGSREYSMRVWIDPERAANYGLTAEDLVSAIRSQNIQVAGGVAGEPPISGSSFQPNLIFDGRLKEPGQFDDIIVKAAEDGRLVRLRDVARVEIGACLQHHGLCVETARGGPRTAPATGNKRYRHVQQALKTWRG